MKPHFLLILFASTILAVNQNSQQQPNKPPNKPLDNICGEPEDKKCLFEGTLNKRVISTELPAYPQKAREKQIEGSVTVRVIFNEDGEVISATSMLGPEELWTAALKAAITTRFQSAKLSEKPVKVSGFLRVNFKNGKIEIPKNVPVTRVLGVP
jgi:TonB family protein